jgi:hypothetical protein
MTTSSLHNSHIISDGPGDGSLNNFQAPVGGPPVVLMRPMVCPAALISRSVVTSPARTRRAIACNAVSGDGCVGSTEWNAGKQSECPELMWAEITLSRRNRHHSQLNERNTNRANRGASCCAAYSTPTTTLGTPTGLSISRPAP